MDGITAKQRGMIFKLKAVNGLDEDTLYELVQQVTGKQHISDLSIVEAIKVIDRLTGKQSRHSKDEPSAATKKQIFLIEKLAEEIGWSDKQRLTGFIKKRFKVDMPKSDPYRWIDRHRATQIIEALKDMKERNYMKQEEK